MLNLHANFKKTTNRIGQIDDASSHVSKFPWIRETRRPCARADVVLIFWEAKKDRKDIIVTERAKRFVTNDAVLKVMRWNGRKSGMVYSTKLE